MPATSGPRAVLGSQRVRLEGRVHMLPLRTPGVPAGFEPGTAHGPFEQQSVSLFRERSDHSPTLAGSWLLRAEDGSRSAESGAHA